MAKPSGAVVMSPYSLFSSDNLGVIITSVQLKGDNYNKWAMEMVNALRAKKKMGFVDGSLPKPDENHKDLEAWLCNNSMIMGWIQTSIESRVRSTVTFITDAHKLWENLKKRFDVGNKMRIHQLMEQLTSCRQNGQAVIDYYGRMAVMWEELQTYRPPPACTCSAAATYEKEHEDERVHQFIMGLDDSRFGNVVTAIIEADDLPDLGKTYAKVIREEARLNASKTRESSQEAIGFTARKEPQQRESRETNLGSARSEGSKSRDRVCYHCGKPGHEKSSCWQLVGYPKWVTDKQRGRGGSRGTGRGYGRGGGRGTAHDRSSKTLIGAGEERDGVYYFKDVTMAKGNKSQSKVDQLLWHQRLGHPAFSVFPMVSGVKDNVCSNVCGPYRVPSSSGAVYLLTIVDDYSRAVWTYLLVAKSEVRKVVERFCKYTEKQFDKSVQMLTVKFWGEAILSANHVLMTPSKILQGKSLYEVLFSKKPLYNSLRVFGPLCYVHRKDKSRDKFGPRSIKCIFVGYPFGKKGWRVYDVETNEFLVSRDVVFKVDVFPYKEAVLTQVDEGNLTGGPDDDWIIHSVRDTEDRGSDPIDVVHITKEKQGVVVTEQEDDQVEGESSNVATPENEAAKIDETNDTDKAGDSTSDQ
ncbi:PREDICTED: uncharacterized protein LOC106308924 [Brassica oleracea var. oleracea]|uniref:uncharacterized protein LOC106308924 n=1 Tax=Brassica oleracea var. oleracea TaxID=109376 RepID=UPI0006A6F7DA|nr:PREDICTED: uncharacterized protein LOC106308924 [Brassica oleracea var. oleracea]